MPVKMIINIHDIPIMIDRLIHLLRVEDCAQLKRVNVTQQTNWYLCRHMHSKCSSEPAHPRSQNFCCALIKATCAFKESFNKTECIARNTNSLGEYYFMYNK